MRFMIYIPRSGAEQKTPAEVGLGGIAEGLDGLATSAGPDGPGMLYGWLSPDQTKLEYVPDVQTWMPSIAEWGQTHKAYWVGIWNESPPTEEDLRRPDHRQGKMVQLGDGDMWSVVSPDTVRHFPMPDEQGKLQLIPDEAMNWLKTDIDKRLAKASPRSVSGRTVYNVDWDTVYDVGLIARVMQINYRITPEVVCLLKLVSDDTIIPIAKTIMGLYDVTIPSVRESA